MAPILVTLGGALLLGHLILGRVPVVMVGDTTFLTLGSWQSTTLAVVILCGAWFVARSRRSSLLPTGLAGITLAVLLSLSALSTGHLAWFESQNPAIEVGVSLTLVACAARLLPGTIRLHPNVGGAWWMLLVLSSGVGIWTLTGAHNFRVLFGDDHAAFLYRIEQLRAAFPAIPFYNPLWNGGVEAREFFPSGALNIFFLFAPLWYAFNPATIYSAVIATVVFVVLPLAHYLGARVLGLSRSVGILAALGALTASTAYYKWALGFGTMGFVVAATFAPLATALWWRIVRGDGKGSTVRVGAVGTTLLVVLWPLGGIILLPAALIVAGACWRGRLRQVSLPAIALALLYLPYVVTLFATSPVAGLLGANTAEHTVLATPLAHEMQGEESPTENDAAGGIARDQAKITKHLSTIDALQESVRGVNPLVLLGVLPGLFLLRRRGGLVFGVTLMWLLFVGGVGPLVKPQLELERMFVVAALFAVIPAAAALDRWIDVPSPNQAQGFGARVGTFALFLLTPLLLWNMGSGKKAVPVLYATPLVHDLVEAIDRHGGEGRVLFAGFTLHELDGGHVAPLALWSSHPLIASRYQHDRWSYTDVIPEPYRKRKLAGIEEYLDLYNVTAVITHDRGWRKWFRKHPGHYREVWNGGRFRIFQRLAPPPGYLLAGNGRVLAQENDRITVKVESREVLLRFNYLPFLQSSGCRIAPHPIDSEIRFIALKECSPGSEVTIRASSIGKRLGRLLR